MCSCFLTTQTSSPCFHQSIWKCSAFLCVKENSHAQHRCLKSSSVCNITTMRCLIFSKPFNPWTRFVYNTVTMFYSEPGANRPIYTQTNHIIYRGLSILGPLRNQQETLAQASLHQSRSGRRKTSPVWLKKCH